MWLALKDELAAAVAEEEEGVVGIAERVSYNAAAGRGDGAGGKAELC